MELILNQLDNTINDGVENILHIFTLDEVGNQMILPESSW